MKFGIKALALGLSVFTGLVHAQDLSVRMVSYKDCHPDLKQLDFSDKPQQCGMSSQAITFMIEGRDIAVLDKKSLAFSKLEVGGRDVRYNRKGEAEFEMGSFPKVDDDGQYALFDVNLNSAPFGHVGSASVDGTLDVFTSERLINEDKAGIDLGKPFSFKAGPLTVSNQPMHVRQQGGVLGKAGEALAEGLQAAFMGNQGDSLMLYITGNLDAFVELEVYENGEKVNSGWSSWDEKEKT